MAEEQEAPKEQEETQGTGGEPAAAAEPQPAAEPEAAPAGGSDVEEGKTFAILSYVLSFIGLPFFLIPLFMRNNAYALYHAKQCLILWILGIASGVISSVLVATVVLACIAPIVALVIGIFCLVAAIMGLVNACKGIEKPLPVIGKWGEQWFKGITKA